LLVAFSQPAFALPIYVLLAVAALLVSLVGARRERPTDAVRATRWVRATVQQAVSLLRARAMKGNSVKKENDDRNR
jgi:hypothetical protein